MGETVIGAAVAGDADGTLERGTEVDGDVVMEEDGPTLGEEVGALVMGEFVDGVLVEAEEGAVVMGTEVTGDVVVGVTEGVLVIGA